MNWQQKTGSGAIARSPDTGGARATDAVASPTATVGPQNIGAEHLHIETIGTAHVVTLDRPKALNALTVAMRAKLAQTLAPAARDPDVYALILRSALPKAFSVGADVREIIALGATDKTAARRAFAEEYALNWQLACFTKPTVAFIDGHVMGSGVGITLYATHRVAGPGYRFAMPETAIGLFPDVGVAHTLARLPDNIGLYLGLTGRTVQRADALALGLVTHTVPTEAFTVIQEALQDAQPVDALLAKHHQAPYEPPSPSAIAPHKAAIAACFGAATVREIIARLEAQTGADADWADAVAAELKTKSPTSLAITLRHIRRARAWDLRQTLMMDYRLAVRCLDGSDFAEGVRAMLVDKDHAPNWQPKTLSLVKEFAVESAFASLGRGELPLATREDMQRPGASGLLAPTDVRE